MSSYKSKFKLYKGILLVKIIKFFANVFGFKIPPVLSVSAIIQKVGKIMAIDLSYQKGLSLPGGLAEENETLEESLKREVFEETGLSVVKSNYFKSYKSKKRIYYVTNVCYLVDVKGIIKSSDEGKVVWVKPSEFIKKCAYLDNKNAVIEYFKLTKFNLKK